nr:S8 family serine peptidase [Bacteroidota bacterium]
MKTFTFLILLLVTLGLVNAQNRDPQQFKSLQDVKLLKLAEDFRILQQAEKAEAVKIAQEKGWIIRAELDDGSLMEIKRLDKNGIPEYDITNNLNAARTSETNHLWTGGESDLNLTGTGMLIGEWDGGGVLTTHQEFNNGSGTRVTQRDSPASTHYHSTHVAGTIIAEGQVNAAHGMASEAELDAYDWDDDMAEMATAAANDDLILSNHSYGRNRGWNVSGGNWYWWGDVTISTTEDYKFGFYGELANQWDEIAHAAPHYLICKSAGNDRDDDHTGGHYYLVGEDWTWSTAARDPDGGADGYDCIGDRGVAKNLLVVGSVEDITAGYSSPADVIIADYSGWGPTDDGRIKPDIVANGQDLYSTTNTGNSSYLTIGGTSMSTPAVTGTLALIQEHYNDLRGGFMNSEVLRGLVINTAHEAGPADGPDYQFGWGLLNATGMADRITEDNAEGGLIVEAILEDGQTNDYTYYCDGTTNINVTICWNDPPHTALTPSLNPTTTVLINDLNLRIIDDSKTLYYPWVLDPASPANAAIKFLNFRDNVETINIQDPDEGFYTVRIHHGTSLTGEQTYALIINGMTTPPEEDYCETRHTSWETYEYIQNVSFGSIDNNSGRSPGGYADYTGLVGEITAGESENLNVTINGYSSDEGKAWVDWNQDGDFNDAGESFVLGSGAGPYSVTINAPADAATGYTTMRVCLTFNTPPTACGVFNYGETEDYSIRVINTLNMWTGGFNHYWHNANNWSLGHIPNGTEDVEIPNVNQPIYVDNYPSVPNEVCKSLLTASGTSLVFYDMELLVNENAVINGSVTMDQEDAVLAVLGDITWNSGSSLVVNNNLTFFNIYGNWISNNGSNVSPALGFVDFKGTTDGYIRSYDPDNSFYNLRVYKSGGSLLGLSSYCTQDVEVKNLIYIAPGAIFNSYTSQDIVLRGNFNYYGTFDFTLNYNTGDFIFDGTSQSFNNYSSGSGLYNNIVFSSSTGTTASVDFQVANNVTINQGYFNAGAHTATVGGNWTTTVGPDGFIEAGSRVIFNGPGHQYIYGDENFNILEVNNGAALRLNNVSYDVTCNSYDWTSGGIDIISGNFTAFDLADDGLFGGYWVNPGGTINLINDSWVDLNGELHNFGGTINVSGSISDWPYSSDAEVEMTAGVIDFKTCGITIRENAHDFTCNITGGTIRTASFFVNERADADLSDVTIELYGPTEADLDLVGGSSIGYLEINKGSLDGLPDLKQTDRNGNIIPTDGKANNVDLMSDISVNNYVIINAGSLSINGFEASIEKGCEVYGSLIMDDESDVLYFGLNPDLRSIRFFDGSITHLNNGEIHLASWFSVYSGAVFSADPTNTIYFEDNPNGFSTGIHVEENGTTFGNIEFINSIENSWLSDDYGGNVDISGDLALHSGVTLRTQTTDVHVHGQISDDPSSELIVGIGDKDDTRKLMTPEGLIPFKDTKSRSYLVEFDSDFSLQGILKIFDNAEVQLHGRFAMESTGSMNIHGGTFLSDAPHHPDKGWQYINGFLEVSDGLFEITHNSINFNSGATSNISGGLLRTGGAFRALDPGSFIPTGGTLEIIGGDEDMAIYLYSGNHFHNLLINREPGNFTRLMNGFDVEVTNNLTIQSGALESHGSNMFIGGNWTNNVGPDGFVESTNTVTFYGSQQSLITTDETFYNLEVDKSNINYDNLNLNPGLTLTVLNDFTTVDGTLNLDDGSELIIGNDVLLGLGSGLNAYLNTGIEIFVGGNWTNENTFWDSKDGYSPGTEILTFNGSNDQIFTSNAAREELGNVVIDKPSGYFKPESNINVRGDLFIENGFWRDYTPGLSHYFEGDFTVLLPNGFYSSTGITNTTVFKGTGDQAIDFPTNGYFYTWVIDKTDWPADKVFPDGAESLPKPLHANGDNKSQIVTMNSIVDLEFGDGLIVEEGTLLLNGNYLRTMGDVNINDGGKIVVDAGARLGIDDDDKLSVNSGGIIEIIGAPENRAIVSHRGTEYYGFEVNSGGSILAENAIFEYIGIDWWGVNIKDGATIDPIHCFNNCVFQQGNSAIGAATLITVNNDQELTITGASFPNATTDYNIGKDVLAGYITFVDFSGDFSGEDYDLDPYNLIEWYEANLEVTPLVRNVTAPAGSTTFDVISTLDWTVTESVPWLTVAPMSGSGDAMLTVNYTENTALTPRIGEITVSADGVDDVVVSVIQEGAVPVLTVTPPERNVLASAGSTTFNVGSNTSWTVSESTAWFTVLPMSGSGNATLTVNYSQNTSVTPRSGQITVSAAGVPDVVVTVNQAGAGTTLTVTPSNRNVTPAAGNTTFSVTSNTGWAVSESVVWLNVTPMSGSGNGTLSVSYGENATGFSRVGSITVTATGGSPSHTVTVTQESYPTHLISLPEGWSGLSSYNMPANNDITDIFSPVSGNFVIAATMNEIYYPAGPVNTIIDWESQSAYKLKMSASASLTIIGNEETNKTLALPDGWSLMPVICNYPVDAATTLAPLDLVVAKDVAGTGVLWPGMGINTLGNLNPGMAYYTLLNAGGSITFPPNSGKDVVVEPTMVKMPENPWNEIQISSSSHLIAIIAEGIEDIVIGDIIGVFSPDNWCYGITEIEDLEQNALITAYADDMTTSEKDGFTEGESFYLKSYRPETGQVYDLEAQFIPDMPNGVFFANEGLSAISQLKLSSNGVGGQASSGISIYPNPTNGIVWITGIQGYHEVTLMNNTGMILLTRENYEQDETCIDMSSFSSGVYQVRLTGEKSTIIRKVIKN